MLGQGGAGPSWDGFLVSLYVRIFNRQDEMKCIPANRIVQIKPP